MADPRTEVNLRGVGQKLDRAATHLHELQEAARMHCEEGPYTVIFDHEPRDGFYIGRATEIREPPLILGVILGDLVHNLRSALDHLVWQLVLASGNRPGSWNTFPLLATPDAFTEKVVIPHRVGRRSPLLGVAPVLLQIFELYQPYDRTDELRAGLSILRDLSNTDKHRVLNSVLFAIGEGPPTIERKPGIDHFRLQWKYGPIDEGDEIVRTQIRTTADASPEDIRVDVVFNADIRFGGAYSSLEDLGGIVNETTACCNEFASLLPLVMSAPADRGDDSPTNPST